MIEPIIEINDITIDGNGIGRYNNLVYFVSNTIPGDIVKVKILKHKKNYAIAVPIEYIKTSENKVNPICSHFNECGGCKWQHINYDQQLFLKEKHIKDEFLKILKPSHDLNFEFLEINKSKKIFRYRNKLEFTFHNNLTNTNNLACGFHKLKKFNEVIDIDTCYLQEEPSNLIRKFVKNWAIERNIEFYNQIHHTGILRNIILRNNLHNDFLVNIVVSKFDNNIKDLSNLLIKEFKEIKSVFLTINDKKNSSLTNTQYTILHGEDHIKESLDDLTFKIDAFTFFQVNTLQALKVYKKICQIIEELNIKEEPILDLYCGIGTITLFVSKYAKKVIGVDNLKENINKAKSNLILNKIDNAEFILGEAEKVLKEGVFHNFKPKLIIVDPPRSGLHKRVIKYIQEKQPNFIIYLSCNPSTQARDISSLIDDYNIIFSEPFDMFPHTYHTENLVLLEKVNKHN